MTSKDIIFAIEKAKEAYDKRQFKKAALYFEEVLTIEPKNYECYFMLANIYHIQGKLGRAIELFKKVLEINPEHTDAMISLSVILNDIGRYDQAQVYFDMANSKVKKGENGIVDNHINKKFSKHHFEIGEMYYSYQRFDEALFEYKKSMSLDPENLEIRVKMAKCYRKKGFVSKAIEELRTLKVEYPNFVSARVYLGLLLYEQGKIIDAQNEWQMALNKDPLNSEARLYLNYSNNAKEINVNEVNIPSVNI
jgi:tetratricopeptide (TPR) repeat protein